MEAGGSSENDNNMENTKILGKEVMVGVGEEDEETLKRRILEHPLCGLLMESHMECLKVGLGEIEEVDEMIFTNQAKWECKTNRSSSDLDLFMKAYCVTLSKLKVAIQEHLQDTVFFVEAMHEQLEQLNTTHAKSQRPSSSYK